jgi:uncharacterized protein YdeI (YjbR/CyaY-like superfamily)
MAETKRSAMTPKPRASDLPTRLFSSKEDWAAWLDRNHGASTGLWLRIAKKGARKRSVTYKDALDVALCYGWIDGQKKPENEETWLQRFVPRSPRSLWSKINRDKALALLAAGEMKPAGLAAIEKAKQAGRWDTAYDSPGRATVPGDLQAALDASPKAKAFFEALDKTNRYAILWRIQTATKAETREQRISHFIGMLERNEKIHK